MDPQKLAGLDPKLREAYQRVMGTTIPEPQAPITQVQTPAASPFDAIPTNQPQMQPTMPSDPATEPQPAINPQYQPAPMPESAMPTQPSSNFVQMNSEVAATPTATSSNFTAPAPETQTVVVKKKNVITPILYGFVGLIFIAVYTIFWAKILNFKLPFLP